MNKVLSKPFLRSLFVVQNEHHKHSVLIHTLKVVLYAIKTKNFGMIGAAFLHDVGKPFTATPKGDGLYKFKNHEELSFHIIKKWPFVSNKTKQLVRWHYLLRAMGKAEERGKVKKFKRLQSRWNGFSSEFKEELKTFQMIDDMGKR